MSGLTERIAAAKAKGRRLVEDWRVRRPWLDHLIRTAQRYELQSGNRLAGAVTYFAFLSFFPLIALAFAVLGYVLSNDQNAIDALTQAIDDQFPGFAEQLDINGIAQAKATAGIIGLLGLLYAGLGAVDALRGALREMSMTTTPPLNFFLGKLRDLVSLILLGLTILASVAVSGFATQATTTVVSFLNLDATGFNTGGLFLAGLAAGLAADWLIFVIVLGWVAPPVGPFRYVARGALLGAIGFGLLKQLAGLLLSHTLGNPLYGTFAVIVGLLLWINFSARLVLYVAAWTATAGLSPPPAPSPIPSSGSPEDEPSKNGAPPGQTGGSSAA
ncbi:YihY/virulence factor BrkB family protein [Nonomuraea cavernae]|uniref:Membrane protein n=1 Tax=Nonomuraea cavernae TaxID=2045107 RepID=A0A917ZH96_9ACTN|nr:YihY/virulence factor BrkB family protein [Nonomuraea cavernae]MCA2189976.1 YihY/virulence factor BrkB family protein [Nonomuraea cavernae]GGO82477.1 membrane protein [Nonomuraea cavernae]